MVFDLSAVSQERVHTGQTLVSCWGYAVDVGPPWNGSRLLRNSLVCIPGGGGGAHIYRAKTECGNCSLEK